MQEPISFPSVLIPWGIETNAPKLEISNHNRGPVDLNQWLLGCNKITSQASKMKTPLGPFDFPIMFWATNSRRYGYYKSQMVSESLERINKLS